MNGAVRMEYERFFAYKRKLHSRSPARAVLQHNQSDEARNYVQHYQHPRP